MTKMLQLYQVTRINHGVMLVGPPGSGKTAAWRVLLEALQRIEKREAEVRVLSVILSCLVVSVAVMTIPSEYWFANV